MTDHLADWNFRELAYQTTDDGALGLLAGGSKTVYCGFDPSADSLHIGNLVPLLALRRFQMAGNRPIVLVGGATGVIGDPSFKSAERVMLTPEVVESNIESLKPQLELLVDFSPGKQQAKLVNNFDWTKNVDVLWFLREIGKHFTVNSLVSRDAIKERFENREQGISYTEFAYPLLQAFDFLHLYETEGCEFQTGASDQWGNMISGVELIRRKLSKTAHVVSLPLLLKPDGVKFGKTESGTNAWLDSKRTPPFALYQFLVRSEDEMIPQMLRRLTLMPVEEIIELESAMKSAPGERQAQKALAFHIVELVHGSDQAKQAENASGLLYSEDVKTADEATVATIASSIDLTKEIDFSRPLTVSECLVQLGLTKSISESARAISQGGVYVNNRRVEGPDSSISVDDLLHNQYVFLRRGKKDYGVLRLKR